MVVDLQKRQQKPELVLVYVLNEPKKYLKDGIGASQNSSLKFAVYAGSRSIIKEGLINIFHKDDMINENICTIH